jgi:hypothetical protein
LLLSVQRHISFITTNPQLFFHPFPLTE